MARVRRERDRFVGFVTQGVEAIPAADKLVGYARFVDDHTLAVGDVIVETSRDGHRHRLVAGISPRVECAGRSPGHQRRRVRLDLVTRKRGGLRPRRHRARARPGAASARRARQGVRARRRRRSALGSRARRRSAPRVRRRVLSRYRRARRSVARSAGEWPSATVRWTARRAPSVSTTCSRRPAARRTSPGSASSTRRLALDACGVPLFDRETMQCGASPIFIAGDANDDVPLLHEAADEGRIAGDNAARFPDVHAGLRRARSASCSPIRRSRSSAAAARCA